MASEEEYLVLMKSSGSLLTTSEMDVYIHCTVCPWKWTLMELQHFLMFMGPVNILSLPSSSQL